MKSIKCESCGAALHLEVGQQSAICEFCGSTNIIQSLNDSNGQNTQEKIERLLNRAYICIEDGDFDEAEELLKTCLSLHPTCARAYVGKLLLERHVRHIHQLGSGVAPLESSRYYQRAIQYADNALKNELQGFAAQINNRIRLQRIENLRQEIYKRESKIKSNEQKIQELQKKEKPLQFERIYLKPLGFVFLILSIIGVRGCSYALESSSDSGFMIALLLIFSLLPCGFGASVSLLFDNRPMKKLAEMDTTIKRIRQNSIACQNEIGQLEAEIMDIEYT